MKGFILFFCLNLLSASFFASSADIGNVKHIVVIMQENHSFDNYFGMLPHAVNGSYHPPSTGNGCEADDHQCVDGLTCYYTHTGVMGCTNFNFLPEKTSACYLPKLTSTTLHVFHNQNYCLYPDLAHSQKSVQMQINLLNPYDTLHGSMNGFANTSQFCERPNVNHYETLGYYTEIDIAYYYQLAQKFSTSDRYFSSTLGSTIPNRLFLYTGTAFDNPAQNPAIKTIFGLLDEAHVSWVNYYHLSSWVRLLRKPVGAHFLSIGNLYDKHAGTFFGDAYTGNLPSVTFIDTDLFGYSEHPPFNIQAGQHYVANLIDAIRKGPNWADTVIILTYDEHGGYYDHVVPPAAIDPGTKIQQKSHFIFNQLGVPVPLVIISPFAKSSYVSHIARDHTSILAFIEKRFLNDKHLTARDAQADPFSDMFDFINMPSKNAYVSPSLAPDGPILCGKKSTTYSSLSQIGEEDF